MVFAHVLVTEAELNGMAGELIDATGWVEANKQAWANQAGGYLCALLKYDLITNVATLTANGIQIFAEYIARYAAMSGIAYNMATVGATFSSLIEPEDMIQLHIYRLEQIENVLRQEGIKAYLNATD